MTTAEISGPKQTKRLLYALIVMGCLISALAPVPAEGGLYHVSQCRLPNGSFTNASDVTGYFTSPFSYYSTTECAARGSMGVALEPGVSHRATTGAFISFSAPPATRIVAVEGNRTTRVGQGGAFRQGTTGINAGSLQLEQCANAGSCAGLGTGTGVVASNGFRFVNLNTGAISFYAACVGGQDCPAEDPKATMTVFRVAFVLEDANDPTATTATGGAARGSWGEAGDVGG